MCKVKWLKRGSQPLFRVDKRGGFTQGDSVWFCLSVTRFSTFPPFSKVNMRIISRGGTLIMMVLVINYSSPHSALQGRVLRFLCARAGECTGELQTHLCVRLHYMLCVSCMSLCK